MSLLLHLKQKQSLNTAPPSLGPRVSLLTQTLYNINIRNPRYRATPTRRHPPKTFIIQVRLKALNNARFTASLEGIQGKGMWTVLFGISA